MNIAIFSTGHRLVATATWQGFPMIAGWVVLIGALVYVCALFGVAYFGDTIGRHLIGARLRTGIYALSLCIYCTSWTFFGSVGLASTSGIDFLPIYIGPILVIGLANPLVIRIVRLAKAQNITSVADFVAARFGKAESVAALVAIIAVIGAVPYVALQLKAVSSSLAAMLSSIEAGRVVTVAGSANGLSFLVALILAGFAIAFGTRRIDATEHQDGLMLAIATESIVKIVAFVGVGAYVTWFMFDGFSDLTHQAVKDDHIRHVLERLPDAGSWITMILVSATACLLLPRQFHVTVVENRNEADVAKAAWLFPLYLIAINIFVLPIAVAGLVIFPDGAIDRDMTVLALPLQAQAGYVALLALIGGLSAATAMVIVASVAVAIMVSNDLVMPAILRSRLLWGEPSSARLEAGDLSHFILAVRRIAILALLLMGYAYYRTSSDAGLAAIGLLSFAAVAQIAPVFIGGLIWRRATSRGALAGLSVGLAIWTYTLFLPSLNGAWPTLQYLLSDGPLGLHLLRPTALMGTDLPPLVHGVVWSLSLNAIAFVAFSLTRTAKPIERLQANIFVGSEHAPMAQTFRLWRASVTVSDLEATVARYLGLERTGRAFDNFRSERGIDGPATHEADIHLLRFAEHLLASAIGAASSRLVLSLLLRRRNVSKKAALKLLDNASAAIQYNRDLLQYALDHARQGITVFDRDLRLICWNREFRDLFDLPNEMVRVGIGLDEIVRFNAERGIYGNGSIDRFVTIRLESLINDTDPIRLRLYPSAEVIEVRSARMPDGGLVTTYADVTNTVQAEEALEATNETLERRVRERTEELVQLNAALGHAKAAADEANLSKTRFLAAASHDILQPLNAARLYATSLVERAGSQDDGDQAKNAYALLARNVNASLEAIEEILTALLDISRLDAGAMKPEFSHFPVNDVFKQLKLEFEPLAKSKGLALTFIASSLDIRSDRRLMRRLLQNLVSNAIKYTGSGRVLVGCRRTAGSVRIEVWDTGPGIPAEKQKIVFQEFQRLEQAAKTAPGLGLGLSIVERIARVLDQKISLKSSPGRGCSFTIEAPRAPTQLRSCALSVPLSSPALPLAGMSILAIDNEPRVLDGMKVLLSGWGCRVMTAINSETAYAALRTASPDAIIADYHLDHENGIEIIANLRRRFGRDIPAVLATADRSAEVRQNASLSDIVVLNKPLKPAALRALLAQWQTMRERVD
jgi:Na+/proline symporter/signal transduction histidine kinase